MEQLIEIEQGFLLFLQALFYWWTMFNFLGKRQFLPVYIIFELELRCLN